MSLILITLILSFLAFCTCLQQLGIQAGQPIDDTGNILITDDVADRLAQTKAKYIRVDFRLGPYSNDSTQFYAAYDEIVDRLLQRDLQIVGIVSYATMERRISGRRIIGKTRVVMGIIVILISWDIALLEWLNIGKVRLNIGKCGMSQIAMVVVLHRESLKAVSIYILRILPHYLHIATPKYIITITLMLKSFPADCLAIILMDTIMTVPGHNT